MAMNVKPVPTLNNEVNEIRLGTAEIINRAKRMALVDGRVRTT